MSSSPVVLLKLMLLVRVVVWFEKKQEQQKKPMASPHLPYDGWCRSNPSLDHSSCVDGGDQLNSAVSRW
jgi:hypothetical protein